MHQESPSCHVDIDLNMRESAGVSGPVEGLAAWEGTLEGRVGIVQHQSTGDGASDRSSAFST